MLFYALRPEFNSKIAHKKNAILGYFSVSYVIYLRKMTILCS